MKLLVDAIVLVLAFSIVGFTSIMLGKKFHEKKFYDYKCCIAESYTCAKFSSKNEKLYNLILEFNGVDALMKCQREGAK